MAPGDEPAMTEAFAAAQLAWPGVELGYPRFAAYVTERLGACRPVAEALAALSTGDLYLACACRDGDENAIAAFERTHLSQVPALVSRLSLPPSRVDELGQLLRVKLFVGGDGVEPKIGDYRGTGPLGHWLRVVALRLGLTMRRRSRDHAEIDEAEAVADALDPEAQAMKDQARAAFQDAVRDAFEQLPPRTRTLLRLHYVDGMSGEALAKMYGVHRITISRWLVEARGQLRDWIVGRLRDSLSTTTPDVGVLLSLVRSHLDVSLRGLLRERAG
jgi:RNA polymerase sigma-70 factor (ECF subfamily)